MQVEEAHGFAGLALEGRRNAGLVRVTPKGAV